MTKNQYIQDISRLVYEPLLNVTEDFKLENALAEEWSKTGDKAYLIRLREGVKWHNGERLTAEDVKYTIEAIKNLGSNYIYYTNVSNIESVETLGINIVKIFLNEEEPFFEYNLTFPIICHSFYEGEDLAVTIKNNIPMGTGMYKLDTVDVNSALELKLNTEWWNIENKRSKIEKINVKIYSSIAELYNAYKLGSIDLLNTSRNVNLEKNIGTLGYNLKENYGRQFEYIALNCESEILSNKEVRQAISNSINRDEIVNLGYGSGYIGAEYPLNYGSYLYNNEGAKYNYNLATARETLQNNGWSKQNKYWQKKIDRRNVRTRLELVVNSSNETRVKVANMIKEDLEEIGMQVNVRAVKDKTYDNYVKNKNYDILLTGVTVGLSPNLNRYFGEGNIANYTNDNANIILRELYSITDEKILKEKYASLQNIYMDDVPYIGLCFNKSSVIAGKDLAGTININWYNMFYNIETWYRKA